MMMSRTFNGFAANYANARANKSRIKDSKGLATDYTDFSDQISSVFCRRNQHKLL
jgi:hypothetical protein